MAFLLIVRIFLALKRSVVIGLEPNDELAEHRDKKVIPSVQLLPITICEGHLVESSFKKGNGSSSAVDVLHAGAMRGSRNVIQGQCVVN